MIKIRLAVFGLVGLIVGCSNSVYMSFRLLCPYEHKTVANKLLHDFPNDIPAVRNVTKLEIPGATHCLVYIRNIHGSIEDNSDEREKN